MENKKQNEEIQSRRDFFKKAAKSALPILGAVLLANAPTIVKAAESESEPMGCNYSCSGGCKGGCGRVCSYGCSNSCSGTCTGGCKGTCAYSCSGSCSGSCRSNSY